MRIENKFWAWVLFSFALFTATAQTDTLEIEEIVISEKRIYRTLPSTPYAVQIIDRQTIQNSPYESIDELLSTHSSIDIRRKGPNDIQADIGIRGGSFEQVLILIDGIKMNDPQTGHHNLNLPLDKNSIERIEIVTGAAARRYGQNAYAGVVNFITKTKSDKTIVAGLEAASYSTYAGDLFLEATYDRFQTNLSGRYETSEGYRHNTDYKRYSVWSDTRIGHRLKENPFRLKLGWMSKKFGANGFYASPDFTEQYEEVQTSVASLSKKWNKKNWSIAPQLYWRRNQDEYIFVRSNPSLYRNLHIGNVVGLETNARRIFNSGNSLGLGVDVKNDLLRSNNLGKRSRFVSSIYADYHHEFSDKLDLNLGMNYSYYQDFGSFFFPGVDLSYSLSNQSIFYGNWSLSSRIPSYTDLYYEDQLNLGNPNLLPEQSNNFEIGYRWLPRKFQMDITAFYRHSNDLIDWIKLEDDGQWQPVNILEVQTYGAESMLKWKEINRWIKEMSLAYTYVHQMPIENESVLSRYSLENLRNNLVFGLQLEPIQNLLFSSQFRLVDRVELDNYFLWDSKLAYRWKSYDFYVAGYNLTDVDYTESNLVPMPGINFRAGITYRY